MIRLNQDRKGHLVLVWGWDCMGIFKGLDCMLFDYEGSKAKSVKVAQKLDLLPETSEKLFEYH